MMVIFVSQCEKKALNRTRRVLDAFADRIGDNTWQTVITEEGLQAVKKLLRQTASKNTAVSCHWLRSRSRSDLLWVVGKRDKFDYRGIVPVNYTEKDISQFTDKSKWKTLAVMQHAVAIAGLFHDFGKATVLFQDKINPNKATENFEPYRHEWVSMRLFQAFVDGKTDEQWLNDLANGNINIEPYCKEDINKENNPLTITTVPPFAKLITWLVLSHHKLPKYPDSWEGNFNNNPDFKDIDKWLEDSFCAVWNSPKCKDSDQQNRVADNWEIIDKGLPTNSFQWKSKACLIATKALTALSQNKNVQDWIHDEIFTSHISRMALMLADHYFSSLTYDETEELGLKNNHYPVYANTHWLDNGTKAYKQQLDEHLIGVADNAARIVKHLPKFLNDLEGLPKNSLLEDSVLKTLKGNIEDKEKIEALWQKFSWQDDAKALAQKTAANTLENGFFGINMASTGYGKTIANAKIMYALGKEMGKIRFNVALGLRTLTLQTGREFQNSLGLSDDELSIAVGGIAVKALFENQQDKDKKEDADNLTGSDSENEYLNPDLQVNYSGKIKDHALSKWTGRKGKERTEQLIQPPVLVCTIDHLIPATEGIKGGQQIAPMLRLLGSDLILDEPDDFGLADLPALCRLVHWSGMLGSRVLLSTATMPPAFVYACFEAYKAGWAEYAKANLDNWNGEIQCAWFDERGKPKQEILHQLDNFKKQHTNFVDKRIAFLSKQPAKRIGKIVNITEGNDEAITQNFADTVYSSILSLHKKHSIENNSGAKISIGLVRMANIDPMIAVAKELMAIDAPSDTCIHYCVYHSRFPLAVRSHIENKLDFVLQRKDPKRVWDNKEGVGAIIAGSDKKNHIFVVLASPVAEVGRDHDYDWAIVEPSSMRSIIQLAGRVLRHRDIYPETANIHLLNKNIKGLKGKEICFEKPGFESKLSLKINNEVNLLQLDTHDLNKILRGSEIDVISSIPRMTLPTVDRTDPEIKGREHIFKYTKLNDLEHVALFYKLTKGDKKASVWWQKMPQWCGEIQRQQRFRDSKANDSFRLWIKDEYHKVVFKWLNENKRPPELGEPLGVIIEHEEWQPTGEACNFWFDLQPLIIYQSLVKDFNKTLEEISERFGEFRIIQYDNQQQIFAYHDNLGIYSIKE